MLRAPTDGDLCTQTRTEVNGNIRKVDLQIDSPTNLPFSGHPARPDRKSGVASLRALPRLLPLISSISWPDRWSHAFSTNLNEHT